MTWVRNSSFPLIPSGLEIKFCQQSEDGRQTWIILKGEDTQTTERLADAILRCLNTPAIVEAQHSVREVCADSAEARATLLSNSGKVSNLEGATPPIDLEELSTCELTSGVT
jgi:hypothetical protein